MPRVGEAWERRMMLWGLRLALSFAEGSDGTADLEEASRLRGDRSTLLDFMQYQGGFTVGRNRGQHAAYDDVYRKRKVAQVVTAKERRAAKVGKRPGRRARRRRAA